MVNIILCDSSANGINLSKELLHKCPTFKIVSVANSAEALIILLDRYTDADIILLDIWLPYTNGLNLIKILTKEYPNYKILVNSVIDNQDLIQELISFGVAGFLCKKESYTIFLEEAITDIQLEGYHFPTCYDSAFIENAKKKKPKLPETGIFSITKQEETIFKLLATDKTNKEIASVLGIKKRTVDTHCLNIYRKLGVTTRSGAIEIGSFKNLEGNY